jgi:hypothetical protein
MALHLIKLCVGVDAISDLAAWQAQRLRDMKQNHQKPELIHITRCMPRRAKEILGGGSLYWVIKGRIAARQKLIELRPVIKEGLPHCGLVYDKELVLVRPYPHRPFQGWRYLDPKYAPPDMAKYNRSKVMPDDLQLELISLGLL